MSTLLETPATTGLTCRVIPCLDVKDGRVVKGVRFEELRDMGDPAEQAARYAAEGADELVFLDIGAAPERRATALEWVRRTAEQVFIPLTVGGGVRQVEDADLLLHAGADKIGINSAAFERPELIGEIARRFGSQCAVLSIDARRHGESWRVVTHGGRRERERDALDWLAEGVERGAGEILLTSVDRDGTEDGYDLELLRAAAARVRVRVRVPIIASGGAGRIEHLAAALAAGASAVLAASIFHQRQWTVAAAKRALAALGLPMRVDPGASP
jgi:cyclase